DNYDRDEYFAGVRPCIIYTPVLKMNKTQIKDTDLFVPTDVYLDPDKLNFAVNRLHNCLTENKQCLVHCAAAQERSPLTVAWYLWKYGSGNPAKAPISWIDFDEAYDFVVAKHPQTLYRKEWLKKCLPKYTCLDEKKSHYEN
ncbi:MAG TPA: hypothetical protein VNX68_16145, partial [Nitrosopumilaceae archaeon]|nr:hypothetical protein [Nitrosopumilaceae archaeon]